MEIVLMPLFFMKQDKKILALLNRVAKKIKRSIVAPLKLKKGGK
jgi:hypothetical protein